MFLLERRKGHLKGTFLTHLTGKSIYYNCSEMIIMVENNGQTIEMGGIIPSEPYNCTIAHNLTESMSSIGTDFATKAPCFLCFVSHF